MVHELKYSTVLVKAGKPQYLQNTKFVNKSARSGNPSVRLSNPTMIEFKSANDNYIKTDVPHFRLDVPIQETSVDNDKGKTIIASYDNSVVLPIDLTTENRKTRNQFVDWLKDWSKPYHRIKLHITKYVFNKREQDLVAVLVSCTPINEKGAKVGRRVVFEECGRTRNFYFFNTVTSKWYGDVKFLNLPYTEERFPKIINWSKGTKKRSVAKPIVTPNTVLRKGLYTWEYGIDAQVALAWSKLDFYITELKHYIAVVYNKNVTPKSRPDRENIEKTLCIFLWQRFYNGYEALKDTDRWNPEYYSYAYFKAMQLKSVLYIMLQLLYLAPDTDADYEDNGDNLKTFLMKYGKDKPSFKRMNYYELKISFLVTTLYWVLLERPLEFKKECVAMLKALDRFKSNILYKKVEAWSKWTAKSTLSFNRSKNSDIMNDFQLVFLDREYEMDMKRFDKAFTLCKPDIAK